MRFTSFIIVFIATLASGCIHGWAPAQGAEFAAETAALDSGGVEHVVREPVRVTQGGQQVGVVQAGDRLQVTGERLVLLPEAGAPVPLEGPDLRLEVSRVDPGLTALHTIVWSTLATGTAVGSFVLYMLFSIASGDNAAVE